MNATARDPHVKYRSEWSGCVSGAGTLLLTETARALRLVEALEVELGGFMRPNAVHHPGKAVCDLAVMLAAGGDCPADVAMLRARPHLFGMVASDPTMSRIVGDLARDPGAAIAGIAAARARARAAAGLLPGGALPLVDGHVIVDIDATLVASHSEKGWPRRTTSAALASTRSWRSPTTAPEGPARRWPRSCDRATPAPTP